MMHSRVIVNMIYYAYMNVQWLTAGYDASDRPYGADWTNTLKLLNRLVVMEDAYHAEIRTLPVHALPALARL